MKNYFTFEQLKKLYEEDTEFKEYVDKCCKNRFKTVDYVLSEKITDEYAKYMLEERKGKCSTEPEIRKTTTNVACGVDES